MRARPLAVVLLSGGLDSCVTAAVARLDYDLALFHANYCQRTLMRELTAFRSQAAFYQVASTLEVDLNYLGEIGGSSLTDFHRAVPTGAVEPPGMVVDLWSNIPDVPAPQPQKAAPPPEPAPGSQPSVRPHRCGSNSRSP